MSNLALQVKAMRRRQRQFGYSLMELMIVAAVIAIMVMAAYPAYVGYVTKAHDTEALEEITSLELMIGRYVINNGSYIDAADDASIQSIYNWRPASQNRNFAYRISANSDCPGILSSCYKVIATGKEGTAVASRTIIKTSWGQLMINGKVIKP